MPKLPLLSFILFQSPEIVHPRLGSIAPSGKITMTFNNYILLLLDLARALMDL